MIKAEKKNNYRAHAEKYGTLGNARGSKKTLLRRKKKRKKFRFSFARVSSFAIRGWLPFRSQHFYFFPGDTSRRISGVAVLVESVYNVGPGPGKGRSPLARRGAAIEKCAVCRTTLWQQVISDGRRSIQGVPRSFSQGLTICWCILERGNQINKFVHCWDQVGLFYRLFFLYFAQLTN